MSNDSVDTQVLKVILDSLVTEPDSVKIDRKIDEQGVLLSITVSPKDMGIVIGRGGSMAAAIKTLLRAVGKAHEMRIRVQFLEPDGTNRYSTDDSGMKISSIQNSSSIEEDLKDFVIN